jgi:hypothetical protein
VEGAGVWPYIQTSDFKWSLCEQDPTGNGKQTDVRNVTGELCTEHDSHRQVSEKWKTSNRPEILKTRNVIALP